MLKQEDQNDALLLPPSSQRTVADSEEGLTVEEDDDNNSVDTPTGRFRQATLGALSAGEDRVESSEDGETHSRETTPSAERPDENVTDRKIKLLERRCQSLERELEYEQQKHEGDTMFLRERVRLVEEGCKKLESEIACLNYVRREQSRAGEASIRSTLIDQAKQIAQLEQSLADRKWLRTFSTLSSTDSVPLDVRDIRADIDVLGHHIKQILAKYEDRVVCSTTSFYKEDDLRSLICRAFGQDILQPAELIGQTINLSTFSLQAVIRSLTAAALCEWVFECSLQEICAKPCALLREYRLHLARQGMRSDTKFYISIANCQQMVT